MVVFLCDDPFRLHRGLERGIGCFLYFRDRIELMDHNANRSTWSFV